MFSSTSEFPVDLLGRYKLIGYIGSGAMGVVYRAADTSLKIDVAIKTLSARADDRKRLIRFQKEARAIGGLKHPNIVRVLDFGVTRSGDAYMVMEYVEGKALSQFLLEKPAADLELALRIFHQICDGVAHAHRHGVIHRDLKSGNIMLESADSPKPIARIIDFGIAALRDPEKSGFQSTGRILGSPAYMSPESSRGQSDARSEVYSLGCLLFECLTGSIPFEAESLLEMARCHAESPPPRLKERISEFDDENWGGLQDIVDKCMEKDPAGRYQTVEQLIADVEVFAEEIADVKLSAASPSDQNDGLVAGIWRSFPVLIEKKSRLHLMVGVVILISGIVFMAAMGAKLQRKTVLANLGAHVADENMSTRLAMITATLDKALRGLHMEVTDKDIAEGKVEDRESKYWLAQSNITNDGMGLLVAYDPHSLDVGWTKITDEGLKQIPKMKNLRDLRLDGITTVTDAGLENLRGNSTIMSLSLKQSNITDRGLEIISTMKSLGILKLDTSDHITDRGVAHLSKLPALHEISLERTNVTPHALASCKNLTTIGLGYVRCDDDDIVALTSLKKLTAIELTGANITAKGLNQLLACPELVWLGLAECKFLRPSDIQRFQRQYNEKHHFKLDIETELLYRGPTVYRPKKS